MEVIPPGSHQIWLSAPPMPRSALSSTLVVGVISFPMDCPKILGFLWPENRRRLSQSWPTAAVPVVLPSACAASITAPSPLLFPSTPRGFPPARAASELEAPTFQPQRKSSPPLPSAPGNYSVSWHKPLCLLFKTPASILPFLAKASCLLRNPPTPGR